VRGWLRRYRKSLNSMLKRLSICSSSRIGVMRRAGFLYLLTVSLTIVFWQSVQRANDTHLPRGRRQTYFR